MISDPLDGITFRDLKRGDKLDSVRLGECEFYRYNKKAHRLDVFDQYGILRYLTVEEYDYDRQEGFATGKPTENPAPYRTFGVGGFLSG